MSTQHPDPTPRFGPSAQRTTRDLLAILVGLAVMGAIIDLSLESLALAFDPTYLLLIGGPIFVGYGVSRAVLARLGDGLRPLAAATYLSMAGCMTVYVAAIDATAVVEDLILIGGLLPMAPAATIVAIAAAQRRLS